MARTLSRCAEIERSIIKKYRKKLWAPFMTAVTDYRLIEPGDRICVCMSGGKDSMLMAKLFQELHRHTEVPFELVFLSMDPGYSEANRKKIEENAAILEIPVEFFETDVFAAAENGGTKEKPSCYLCARMRRGYLYSEAQKRGCNKIALGHHLNDVIETTVMAMFHSAQLTCMIPKAHSENFEGMELIRPMYCIREDDIIAWAAYNGLSFLRCACRFSEVTDTEATSRRKEIKALIASLREKDPDIERNIFHALHSVRIGMFPGWKEDGVIHSFLERY